MTILVTVAAPLLLALALVYQLIYRPWLRRESAARPATLALVPVRVD